MSVRKARYCSRYPYFWPLGSPTSPPRVKYYVTLGKHASKIELRKREKRRQEQNDIRKPTREHSVEYYEKREQLMQERKLEDEENQSHIMEGINIVEFGEDDWCLETEESDDEQMECSSLITLENFPLQYLVYPKENQTQATHDIDQSSTALVSEQKTAFDLASLDVWKEILDLLSPQDKMSFCHSCKSARRISLAVIESVTISAKFNKPETLKEMLNLLNKSCPRILGLDFSQTSCMNDDLILHLPSTLKLLNLRGCDITPNALGTLSKLSLHCLDVSENNSFRRKPLLFPPSLQHLKMDFCIHMKNSALKNLPKGLKSLSLIKCVSISDGKISQLQTMYDVITEPIDSV